MSTLFVIGDEMVYGRTYTLSIGHGFMLGPAWEYSANEAQWWFWVGPFCLHRWWFRDRKDTPPDAG